MRKERKVHENKRKATYLPFAYLFKVQQEDKIVTSIIQDRGCYLGQQPGSDFSNENEALRAELRREGKEETKLPCR